MSSIIWGFFKYLGMLRIDFKTEIVGYDYVEFADELDFRGKKLIKRNKGHGHHHVSQSVG